MLRRGRATAWQAARPGARARFNVVTLFAVVALFSCGRLVPDAPPYEPPGDDGGFDEASSACTADIYTDVNNCGACGILCPSEDTCSQGVCIPPPPDSSLACSSREVGCGPDQTCCENHCLDATSDPLNCGGCGIVCPSGVACIDSVCGGCYNGETCTAAQACCPLTGCTELQSDAKNCGACGWGCPVGDICVAGKCSFPCQEAGACAGSDTCCGGGCTNTGTDPANCGGCGVQCGATATCLDGTCAANEGAFNPTVSPTYLTPGGHYFTTINVPAGVTVYVAGTGAQSATLDLHATGAIEIDGTIDLSGGPGTQNTLVSLSDGVGRAGSGGFTGEPYASGAPSAACSLISGNSGQLGVPVSASPGNCDVPSTTECVSSTHPDQKQRPSLVLPDANLTQPAYVVFAASPAAYGGGAGVLTGYRAFGSGGGGPAGGAPGVPGTTIAYEHDCLGVAGGGGAVNGLGGYGGGAPYNGSAGGVGQTQCGDATYTGANLGGGGGGSIGATASADLAVASTFQTGSGGGGGSVDYSDRPYFGGTSGGGGGGGALKLETTSTITIKGQLLANGGVGGDAYIGNPTATLDGCDPQPGAAGGGGSGGVISLSAPSITVAASASLSAAGGRGGAQSQYSSGGSGGAGGLGRIRFSVTPSTCSLSGTFQPPLAAGCQVTASPGKSGAAFIGTYPN